MAFELPQLPYLPDALQKTLSSKTINFHYGKHHQAYVNNLNNLIKGTPFENASLEKIIMESDGAIFNNGAQTWNHTFYFLTFSPNGGEEPKGKLAELIQKQYGSFSEFKQIFSNTAISLFGSGWVWFIQKSNGELDIVQESNAGNPMRTYKANPLLTCDVWEHAYYLDYQNRRADYVQAFWEIIDWEVVNSRLK